MGDVNLTILDGGLGLVPTANAARTHLKIGVAPKGTVNTIQGVADLSTLTSTFGKGGRLVEAAALALQPLPDGTRPGPVYLMPANPSNYGIVGSSTKTAIGSGSTSGLSPTAIAFQEIRVKCAVGGALATATVQFSLDSGSTWSAAVATAAAVMCPVAPFVTFAFSAGTYNAGDTWTVSSADGTVTFSGTGTNGCTVTTASPVDAYNVIVVCTGGGALGAAQVTISLDNGNTTIGPVLVPASGKYAIPNTGVLLTFTNALVTGDAWSFTVTSASYSTTDLTNAMTAALADSRTWGFVHVVGPASTAAGANSVATTLQTSLDTAAGQYRYARGIVEFPTDTDANLLSAVGSTTAARVNPAAGYAYVVSPLSGRQYLMPSGFLVAARAHAVPVSEDLGRVATGALGGASLRATNTTLSTQRDESATPGLDAGRFSTLRSIIGLPGVYITAGRTLATPGSDYSLWQNGRVMDTACGIVRLALLPFLNTSLRVNSDGTLNEKDAGAIEAQCKAKLDAGLVTPGDASNAYVVVSRTQNILSTQTLAVSVRVVPLGYARTISVDIGFQNPAITK